MKTNCTLYVLPVVCKKLSEGTTGDFVACSQCFYGSMNQPEQRPSKWFPKPLDDPYEGSPY